MLVISGNIVLAPAEAAPGSDHPLVGWRNVVTPAGITASSTMGDYPASNLANPATHLQWRAAAVGITYVTIVTNETNPIDYVAVARHNFSSAEIPASIEGLIGGAWVTIAGDVMLPDDGPVLFRFTPQSLAQVRIKLGEGIAPPRAAVVYVGKLLVMERKVYAGHTPLPHGRRSTVANGRSESGEFLGRLVLGEWRETTVPISLMSPGWYRANMDAFLASAIAEPFFFAWRPDTYPREVGFATLMEDPVPVNEGPSNNVSMTLKLSGVA